MRWRRHGEEDWHDATLPRTWNWWPIDVDTWAEETGAMSAIAEAVYLRLLNHSWRWGPLAADRDALAGRARVTPRELERVWPRLAQRFELVELDGEHVDTGEARGYVSPRLEREREKALILRAARAAGGASRADAIRDASGNYSKSHDPLPAEAPPRDQLDHHLVTTLTTTTLGPAEAPPRDQLDHQHIKTRREKTARGARTHALARVDIPGPEPKEPEQLGLGAEQDAQAPAETAPAPRQARARRSAKGEVAPLPFRAAQAASYAAEAIGAIVLPEPWAARDALALERLVRVHPDPDTWRLFGRWLASSGRPWPRPPWTVRQLAEQLPQHIGAARAWAAAGEQRGAAGGGRIVPRERLDGLNELAELEREADEQDLRWRAENERRSP